ncbi:MAG: transposase [Labilithrix sp.]|nr:transposase [Labilithrix sp.]
MRREYGRSLRGRRVTGTRPIRSWKTISLIGAIRLGATPKIMTSKTAVDGPKFLRFVKQRLGPWIYPGDIVIMDNLAIHKMLVVREAILDAGGFPVYLPTYSPELYPIGRLWADMKRQLRTLALNAQDQLLRVVPTFAPRPRPRRSPRGSVIPNPRLASSRLDVNAGSGQVPCQPSSTAATTDSSSAAARLRISLPVTTKFPLKRLRAAQRVAPVVDEEPRGYGARKQVRTRCCRAAGLPSSSGQRAHAGVPRRPGIPRRSTPLAPRGESVT